jgi:F-type H+-transporting ATPase subunit delta
MIKIPLSAYAEAYVSAMPKGGNPSGELQSVQTALTAAPELASYIAAPSIPEDDRDRALKISAPETSDATRRFVLLLAKNRLLKRLDRVAALVRHRSSRARGEAVVSVASAIPLIDRERKELSKIFEARTGLRVSLAERIDPSINGGLLVRLDDWEFDATVTGKLKRLERHLVSATNPLESTQNV